MSTFCVTYPPINDAFGRRCFLVGKFDIGEGGGTLVYKDTGQREEFRSPQPFIGQFAIDPRAIVETIGGRLLYNPRAYRARMVGWFGEWLDEHSEWPANRDDIEVIEVDDYRQLSNTNYEMPVNFENGQWRGAMDIPDEGQS